jgi:hypothetical protein
MEKEGSVILSEAKDLLFSCTLDSIRDAPTPFFDGERVPWASGPDSMKTRFAG